MCYNVGLCFTGGLICHKDDSARKDFAELMACLLMDEVSSIPPQSVI